MSRIGAPVGVVATALLAPWASSVDDLYDRQSEPLASAEATEARVALALDRIGAKHRKLMARAAALSTAVVGEVLASRPEIDRTGAGLFAGVGASDAGLGDFQGLVRASLAEGALCYARLGAAGLAACHPLFAFRIMNNFTLTHPAIAEGLRGPNAAFFSRGAATVHALIEAAWSITEGSCAHALVLGADSSEHPLTLDELAREGHAVTPSEAAAVLVLARHDDPHAQAVLLAAELGRLPPGRSLVERLDAFAPRVCAVVLHVQNPDDRQALLAHMRADGRAVTDLAAISGTTLAAGPIIGACLAVAMIARGAAERVVVVDLDWDGAYTFAIFARRGAE